MAKRPIREPGHMSQAQYAQHRNCGRADVLKALKAGRIHLEKDGAIDPARADREWAASTNPASNSRPGARPGQKAVSTDAVKAASDVLRAAGKRRGEGPMTFTEARTANEIVKAQMGAIRLAERRGELINKKRAEALAFEWSRRVRDALVVWPSRRSALLANDLGIDPHTLEIALDREVRTLLTSVSNIDPNEVIHAIDRVAAKAK